MDTHGAAVATLPQHETTGLESPENRIESASDSEKLRPTKSKRKGRRWRRLDRTALLALCCLWLASPTHSASSASERREGPLRRLADLVLIPSTAPAPPPPISHDSRGEESMSPLGANQRGESPIQRETAIASLLTNYGYNTAFGSQPLCWKSANHTRQQPYTDVSSTWNITGIIDHDIFFPNPLVGDFAYLPGQEEVLPSCFQNSYLSIQKPQEALDGGRLRTFIQYEFQINLTIDFRELIEETNGRYGDAVLTATPNKSQVALQVMHCVLGKSGVCIPFLHEQAYARDYLQQGQKPAASKPGFIHGETHIHTNFVLLDLLPNQTFLQQSLGIPSVVHMEGVYFVLAALQFYTGDSASNIAYYRWDMANAMAPRDRIVGYQNQPEVLEVSRAARIVSYVLIAAASAVILFLTYQTIYHREEQALKLTQGDFLVVFLLSALTATVSTFLLEPKNDLYCNLGTTLVILPVQLMYAVTAGRLWRINAVISPLLVEHMRKKTKWTNRFVGAVDAVSSSLTTLRLNRPTRDIRRSIPKWELAVVVGMFVSPQVILQTAQFIWQQQDRVIEWNEEETIGRAACGLGGDSLASSILFYSGLALLGLIGVVLGVAYSSRNLPSLFNETQLIYDSTFTSVVLMFVGAGIIAITDRPDIPPDVEYMVWVVGTLCITLNSSLRIMIPKLKLIWKGEQVIVSKLVSDHHRKQREKDLPHMQHDGLSGHRPSIMRNVSGLDDYYGYNIPSSYNKSFGVSTGSLNYDGTSLKSINYRPDSAEESLTSEGASLQKTAQPNNALSMSSQTEKMANLDEWLEPEDAVGSSVLPNDGMHEQGQQNRSPSQALPSPPHVETSRNSTLTDKEESMDFQELTWIRTPSTKADKPAGNAHPKTNRKKEPEVKKDAGLESDGETVGSNKGIRSGRFSPRRVTGGKSSPDDLVKRSSEPLMDSSLAKTALDKLGESEHVRNKRAPRRRWSPVRESKVEGPDGSAKSKQKIADVSSDCDADTVGSAPRNRRLRWPPLGKDPTNSEGGGNGLEMRAKSATIPHRRQSSVPFLSYKSPARKLQPDVSAPKRLRRLSADSSRVRQRPSERIKVAPDETPARRLVLKMIDLQEQLTAVNKKIISGLVVAPEEWDLLTLLTDKLHNTFEHEVDFSWREKAETPAFDVLQSESNNIHNSTGYNGPSKTSHSGISNRQGQNTLRKSSGRPPTKIAIPKNDQSPTHSPKSGKATLKRGSVANPSELAATFRNMIDVRDRRKSMVKHKNCFVGSDAVDSIMYSGMASTREEAVQMGRTMVKAVHLFKNVNGDYDFEDDDNLYRFVNLKDCWSSSEEEGDTESVKYPSILEEEPALAQKAVAFREVVSTRDRTYRMQTFKSVFVGSEAVDSLVYAGVASTRWEAVQLGRKLAREHRLFKHVADRHDFKDDFLFYRFCEPDDGELTSQFLDLKSNCDQLHEDSQPFSPEDTPRNDLADKADAFRMYVDVRNRTYRLQKMKDVFVGSEAVDILVSAGVTKTRKEAVELGRNLMKDLRLFAAVRGDDKFSDNRQCYYRFQDAHLPRMSMDHVGLITPKREDEVMLTDLHAIGEAFRQLVDVKDRRYRFRTYRNCFVGAEAVDAMVSTGLAGSRAEAVELGRALTRELAIFTRTHERDKPFEDSYTFYSFVDPDHSSETIRDDTSRGMTYSIRGAPSEFVTMDPNCSNHSYSDDSFALVSQAMSGPEPNQSQSPFNNSIRRRSSGTSDRVSSQMDSDKFDSNNGSFLANDLGIVSEMGESKSTELN